MEIIGKGLTAGDGSVKRDLLWDNVNMTVSSEFGAQTLTGQNLQGIQNYPLTLIKIRNWNSADNYAFTVLPIFSDQYFLINMAHIIRVLSPSYCGERIYTVVTDGVTVSQGTYNNATSNGVLVPKDIYGVE